MSNICLAYVKNIYTTCVFTYEKLKKINKTPYMFHIPFKTQVFTMVHVC